VEGIVKKMESTMTVNAKVPLSYPTNALDRGLRLIQLVRDEGRIRVMEAADELGISRSSAHRLLQALVYRDFVTKDEDHNYVPGPALLAEAAHSRSNRALRKAATPVLATVAGTTGYQLGLVVLVSSEVRVLASTDSTNGWSYPEGAVLPTVATAGGLALLSSLDDAALLAVCRTAAHTETDLDALLARIRYARRDGFAVTSTKVRPRGSGEIATLVRDPARRPVGAVTISTHAPLREPEFTQLLEVLFELRREIERALTPQT
jgi:DNA-binding IclR family transcriptional regulator